MIEKAKRPTPASLSHPCFDCKKAKKLLEELKDPFLLKVSLNNCIDNCPDVEYFNKYHINQNRTCQVREVDFLVEWITEILVLAEAGEVVSPTQLDQLRVWSDRLSLIVAMEEARIEAARSTLGQVKAFMEKGD
jgi:hypothetical protein